MNLSKILDLVKNGRKNVSCGAYMLTFDDARNKYKDYQYAVVNALDGMPLWICKTLEDARDAVKTWQPYCCIMLDIIDLRKERNYEGNVKSANGWKNR